MSLEGSKYLLDRLPVKGPVDSWIGMKATSNWENDYGHKIGVGIGAKAKVSSDDFPFKKELNSIMKFRVFAALSPLCVQKVVWKDALSIVDRHRDFSKWRQRDTDITFSGL